MSDPEAHADDAHLAQALKLMNETGALADTVARAAHYGEKAKDALGLFKDSDTRAVLLKLVDFCIARAY